jgi:hypothetical protein
MTRFTSKQIYDLNNSMSSMQNVNLGTILGNISASATMATGLVTPISSSICLVSTGLTSISGWTWSYSGSPSGLTSVSASIVAGNGTLNLKSWNSYAAATGWCEIRWVAWGEL